MGFAVAQRESAWRLDLPGGDDQRRMLDFAPVAADDEAALREWYDLRRAVRGRRPAR